VFTCSCCLYVPAPIFLPAAILFFVLGCLCSQLLFGEEGAVRQTTAPHVWRGMFFKTLACRTCSTAARIVTAARHRAQRLRLVSVGALRLACGKHAFCLRATAWRTPVTFSGGVGDKKSGGSWRRRDGSRCGAVAAGCRRTMSYQHAYDFIRVRCISAFGVQACLSFSLSCSL